VALECGGERVECADAVAGGGGEVGAERAEFLGSGRGAHAAGDLDPEFAHADCLLGGVVSERDAQVAGEPQVVGLAGLHPGGEGVPFLLELALAGGVEGDPGLRGLAVPVLVLGAGFRVDGGPACGAGGVGGLVQGEERVDGLLRPGPVEVRAGLGGRGQLAQHVRSAQSVGPATLPKVS
jgi:hypothetical protein